MTAPSRSSEIELPRRLRHFTDRKAALDAFDALWPGDGTWVLAFDGISGNGKTTLIDYLIWTRCQPNDRPWAVLDFEGARGMYTRGRDAARAEYEKVRRTLQIQIEQKADQGGQIENSPLTVDATQSEAERHANQRARHATATALQEAAIDVHAQQPIILFLDTYELLARAADKEYAGWLWSWLSNAATRLPRLRVIVGSRDKLEGLTQRERRQEPLEVFDRADSEELLHKLDVDNPAWQSAVFERLAGGHPLLTEMAADLWQAAQKSGRGFEGRFTFG